MTSSLLLLVLSLPPIDIEPAPAPEPEPEGPIEAPDDELPSPFEPELPSIEPESSGVPTPETAVARPATPTADVPPRPARPPRPIVWRVDLAVAGGQTISFDQDYHGLDDNRAMPGVQFGLRADARLGQSRVFLGGVLSYDRGGSQGTIYDDVATYTRVHDPLLGMRLGVAVFDGLDPYVEVAGGPSIQVFEFALWSGNSDLEASQTRLTGNVTALAGVSAYLPKRWLVNRQGSRVTAGVDFGLGYRYRGKVRLQPEHDDQPGDINSEGPDLGQLALRGLVWRLGLFVRFM